MRPWVETALGVALIVAVALNVVLFYRLRARLARTERELQRVALQDPLTGLSNRASALQRLNAAKARRERSGALYGLLYVDLDRFKPVNDTYGHAVGDMVLQVLAQRMATCVRGSDTACRLGGDEFVICLEDLGADLDTARSQAKAAARRLYEALCLPVEVHKHEITVGASIGIAVPKNAETPEVLLNQGDQAMYRAKSSETHYVIAAS